MLSETRKMLKPYAHVVLETMDVNQVASSVGHTAEFVLMNYYGWLKNGNIGNEKGYDATDKDGNKHEIKGMSYESKTNYVAYKHAVKGDKYDYLSILHFNKKRVAHIPREEINKFVKGNTLPGKKTKTLRLCFSDPILTKLGKLRKKSLFLSLFLKYEDKNFNQNFNYKQL